MTIKTPTLLAIDNLRAFVRALKKRPDIKVEVATLGRKAPKSLLNAAEGTLGPVLGGELLAFYAAMNGVDIRWHFIEGPGGGLMQIPPLTSKRGFAPEKIHHMGFGAQKEAMFLDGTGDGGAWIVRPAKSNASGEIIFAMAAEGDDGIPLGTSLSDYLNAAIESGAVVNWPRCTGAEGGLYGKSEQSLRKFKAPPVKPRAIAPGVRVHSRSFERHGRGEVLDLLQISDDLLPSYLSHVGVNFIKIKFDVGVTAWASEKYAKAQKHKDAYETLRGNLDDKDVEALVETVTCAVGPAGSTGELGRDNATRGAGLLGSYELEEAFERTLNLYDQALELGLDLNASRNVEARKKEVFATDDFVKRGWTCTLEDGLVGLFGGLSLLLTEAAHRRNTTGAKLLNPEIITRLMAYEIGSSRDIFLEILSLRNSLEEPARPVRWASQNQDIATRIGLADGEKLFMGY